MRQRDACWRTVRNAIGVIGVRLKIGRPCTRSELSKNIDQSAQPGPPGRSPENTHPYVGYSLLPVDDDGSVAGLSQQ